MEKETTTKSCILHTMKRVREEFLQIIKTKMETENLGIRELARRLGVSHPTVTEVVTYGNMPSFDTCIAFASWLDIPKVSALRISGLLPPDKNIDEWVDEQVHKLKQIPPDLRPAAGRIIASFVEETRETKPVKRTQKASLAKPRGGEA